MEVYYLSAKAHPDSIGSFIQKLLEEENLSQYGAHIAKIRHLAKNGGHPIPPYAKPVRAGLNEIRSDHGQNELLRIYYFLDKEAKRMVLLNITLKPKLYEKQKGTRVNREIEKDIEEAIRLKEEYLTSKNNYDKFYV